VRYGYSIETINAMCGPNEIAVSGGFQQGMTNTQVGVLAARLTDSADPINNDSSAQFDGPPIGYAVAIQISTNQQYPIQVQVLCADYS
jgi:hypothetical protein